MDTLGAIVGPLSALLFLALWPGNYRVLLGVTLVPGIVAAGLIGFTVQENRRAPVHLLPVTYRRFLMAVGIFGVGAVAHTLLILLVTQRLTPSLGATAAGVAVPLYVLHNFFYAGFSYLGGLLADRFPKNLLLIGGYTLAGVRCLGVVFLPASIGSLAIVFMLGGVQVAFEKTLEDPFCAELVEPAQHGMAFGVLATAGRLGRSVLIGRS
jgi:MFS family permease